MSMEWRPVSSYANHFPCDLCDKTPVGFVEIRTQNRSRGGYDPPLVFCVCKDHIDIGTPVYPVYKSNY